MWFILVGFFGFDIHAFIRNKRKRQATIDTSVFELIQIGFGWEGRYHDGRRRVVISQ